MVDEEDPQKAHIHSPPTLAQQDLSYEPENFHWAGQEADPTPHDPGGDGGGGDLRGSFSWGNLWLEESSCVKEEAAGPAVRRNLNLPCSATQQKDWGLLDRFLNFDQDHRCWDWDMRDQSLSLVGFFCCSASV